MAVVPPQFCRGVEQVVDSLACGYVQRLDNFLKKSNLKLR